MKTKSLPSEQCQQLNFGFPPGVKVRKPRKENDSWKLVNYYVDVRRNGIEPGDRGQLLAQASRALKNTPFDDLRCCIDFLNRMKPWSEMSWKLGVLSGSGWEAFQRWKKTQIKAPGYASRSMEES